MGNSQIKQYISWLNFDGVSYIQDHARTMLELIQKRIHEGEMDAAIKKMENICALCDREQKAEVLVECASILFEINNYTKAIQCLDQARVKYVGDRHRVAVVRWISGFVFWQMADGKEQAIRSWIEAIKHFEWLRDYHRDDAKRIIWYLRRIKAMKSDLDRSIKEDGIPFLLE